jgi:leucyl aminopeptidase
MKFKIILHEYDSLKKPNWHLTGEYSLAFNIPLSYLSAAKKNMKIDSDLVRRQGAEVHSFLISLNKAYYKIHKFKSISVDYSDKCKYKNIQILDHFLEGFSLANYKFNRHKTSTHHVPFILETNFNDKITDASFKGVCVARDLVNEPLSHLNAEKLSNVLEILSKESGFKLEVLNEEKIKKLKMGGVLSVNKGSLAKPTFNILTYRSKKSKSKNPIVLVGKGVMYDTGGLSLKPTPNSMDMMKCDMGGAAAVIGSIYALALAKADCYIIGLIPAVENRPGGEAYVPGDVITMMNGKTVEVLNTDAEGRLILADALHYAKRYNPDLVIDLATLTGSASRAIGKYGIVAMENYKNNFFEKFSLNMKGLVRIGNAVGERVVVQPFWDDYKQELESEVADIKNLGGPEAGHITAGKFLEYFVDYPWIHLDIAGVAFLKQDYLYHKKGGTGIGVRLLTIWLANHS